MSIVELIQRGDLVAIQKSVLPTSINQLDHNGNSLLGTASINDNAAVIELLLKIGADVNLKNTDGKSPMSIASRHGNFQAMRALGTQKWDVSEQGYGVLLDCVQYNNSEIIEWLYHQGITQSLFDDAEKLPIVQAIYYGQLNIVKKLVELGFDVNQFESCGNKNSPLMMATYWEKVDIIQYLLGIPQLNLDSQRQGHQSLMVAIDRKNHSIVHRLLEAGINPNDYDPDIDFVPMVQAGYAGIPDIAKELIKYGAKIDAIDRRNESALTLASYWGYHELVRYLLSENIDLTSHNQGKVSLLKAIDQDNHRIVKYLLEAGQNANSEDPEVDKVPIIVASYKDNEKIIKSLLEYGADINAIGPDSSTSLTTSAYWGHEKALDCLLEHGVALEKGKKQGFRALITSIDRGYYRITRKLLKAGVNPGDYDPEIDHVPMVSAGNNGTVKTLEILVEFNHDINSVRHDNHTALTIASYWNHEAAVIAIIEANVAMEKHRQGWRALIIAIERGYHRIVRLLLKAGVDASSFDAEVDKIPFIVAACEGNVETLKILIGAGYDPNINGANNENPLSSAVFWDHYDATKYLIESTSLGKNGKMIEIAIGVAEKRSHSRIAALLSEFLQNMESSVLDNIFACIKTGDISVVNNYILANPESVFLRLQPTDQTPLMLASIENQPAIVESLLDHGAHIDASDNERQTSLILATRLGHQEVVRILLQRGANPNLTMGPQNRTSLMIAIENEQNEIFNMLIQHEANHGYPDLRLRTPLMYAAEQGRDHMLQTLIEKGARIQDRDGEDSSAVMLASYKEHQKTAQILLESGATIETRDLNKMSGIEWSTALIKQFARKSLASFF
ncbi:hypothetical protein K7432_009404 [Basidiobolus ranarum]|uniref:Ankyrin n=1 Tax=Basidiobolus ranarum TaxID=34480 RepID=A0ABR2WQ93_9FUNG